MRYPQLARRAWTQVLTVGVPLVAAGLVLGGCERSASLVAPAEAPAVRAAKVKALPFVFTKVPATVAVNSIAPAADVSLFDFDITTNLTKSYVLTQVQFMVSGSLQAGYLTNYRLVYYPDGRAKPGVVIATNDGSTWVAPGGYTFITLHFTTPIAVGNNFKGSFSFLADVVAPGPYFVWTMLSTASASINGGPEQFLIAETCDLPLRGDQFNVN